MLIKTGKIISKARLTDNKIKIIEEPKQLQQDELTR